MIEVTNVTCAGIEQAMVAMRNPKQSWDKNDSGWEGRYFHVGPNDMKLAKQLWAAGRTHRTFAHMIMVWMTVKAPLYWWKQMDRYRFGKEQISTSTMHTLLKYPFKMSDFNFESPKAQEAAAVIISRLNSLRANWMIEDDPETKKAYWNAIIELLPESYHQTRTIMFSYEFATEVIDQRSGHKLGEWAEFLKELKRLPHLMEFRGEKE